MQDIPGDDSRGCPLGSGGEGAGAIVVVLAFAWSAREYDAAILLSNLSVIY